MDDARCYIAYRRDEPGLPRAVPYILTVWRPSWFNVCPAGIAGGRWRIWWLMDRLGVFCRGVYSIILVRDPGGGVCHRSVIFPRFFRFNFMARGDIQVGDVWTDPTCRGLGLAESALSKAASDMFPPGGRIWWIAGVDNPISRSVAEAVGFRAVALVERRTNIGFALTTHYHLIDEL